MRKTIGAGFLLASVLMGQAATAIGDVGTGASSQAIPGSPRIHVVQIHGPGVVHAADGSTFYPTGIVPEGTLLVIPDEDGRLPGGASLADPAARQASGLSMTAAVECYGGTYMAVLNTWTGVQTATNCVHIGTVSGTATYWFGVAAGLPAAAIGQGLGYYQGYNGSTFGVWAKWYNLGYASDGGSTSTVVPWVNVAANPKFKAMGVSVLPAVGNWGV